MLNYHKITKFDTANGPGIRSVLWVSGCNHHCKGCHNPETWDKDSGVEFTEDSMKELLDSLDKGYVSGITISGGDPFLPDNIDVVTTIVKTIRERFPNKSIWCYTGYAWESVCDFPIIKYLDVLVDGKFVLPLKDITLTYCGSTNQRVIDVKKSTLDNVVLFSN